MQSCCLRGAFQTGLAGRDTASLALSAQVGADFRKFFSLQIAGQQQPLVLVHFAFDAKRQMNLARLFKAG
jgi:hypothetical protein